MSQVTASLVQELRQLTGVGMMECKKALVAANGDIELAVDNLKQAGALKAEKKSSRITAEGLVSALVSNDAKFAVIVEVNCETDFVARSDDFINFCNILVQNALTNKITTVDALNNSAINAEQTVNELRLELITKLGENITVRRLQALSYPDAYISVYMHGATAARIGALVVLQQQNDDLAKDVAMQVAAMKPEYLMPDDIPADVIEREKNNIATLIANEGAGKPQEILDKMTIGKLKKFMDKSTLLGQPFFKDETLTMQSLLTQHKNKVLEFVRYEVGEGLEKRSDNFVEEVMAQVKK